VVDNNKPIRKTAGSKSAPWALDCVSMHS